MRGAFWWPRTMEAEIWPVCNSAVMCAAYFSFSYTHTINCKYISAMASLALFIHGPTAR